MSAARRLSIRHLRPVPRGGVFGDGAMAGPGLIGQIGRSGRVVYVRLATVLPHVLDRRRRRSAVCPVFSALCEPYSSEDFDPR
jgi:hypothetical protein